MQPRPIGRGCSFALWNKAAALPPAAHRADDLCKAYPIERGGDLSGAGSPPAPGTSHGAGRRSVRRRFPAGAGDVPWGGAAVCPEKVPRRRRGRPLGRGGDLFGEGSPPASRASHGAGRSSVLSRWEKGAYSLIFPLLFLHFLPDCLTINIFFGPRGRRHSRRGAAGAQDRTPARGLLSAAFRPGPAATRPSRRGFFSFLSFAPQTRRKIRPNRPIRPAPRRPRKEQDTYV